MATGVFVKSLVGLYFPTRSNSMIPFQARVQGVLAQFNFLLLFFFWVFLIIAEYDEFDALHVPLHHKFISFILYDMYES